MHGIPWNPDLKSLPSARQVGSLPGRRESPARGWKSPRGLRVQIALEQVDPAVDARVALRGGLDALGDDAAAELATQGRDRTDDAALGRVAVQPAHERHVELDDLRLERRERAEGRVARAEIVDRDPVAEL